MVLIRLPVASLRVRILTINIIAIAIVVAGIFYLDRYENRLFETKIENVEREGALIAAALSDSIVEHSGAEYTPRTLYQAKIDEPTTLNYDWLNPETAKLILQRPSMPPGIRVRLFDRFGNIVVDVDTLKFAFETISDNGYSDSEPISIEQEKLLPVEEDRNILKRIVMFVYEWISNNFPPHTQVPILAEPREANIHDFPGAKKAYKGKVEGGVIRKTDEGRLVAVVALPVRKVRRVHGVALISSDAEHILRNVRDERFGMLLISAIGLGITILLSLYLAISISNPVRRLAEAAEQVRAGHGRKVSIPGFKNRRDEIGGLSRALGDMTTALWDRQDSIERFIQDVVHEIKNPLTSLRTIAETARIEPDPEKRNMLLDIVAQDVTRLNRLLNDLTEASRIDAEMSRAEFSKISINKLIGQFVEMQRPSLEAQGMAIILNLTKLSDPYVLADVDKLVQVFQNLLSNALSFSPSGGIIHISVSNSATNVYIKFEDQGAGIPEDLQEAVFKRFYKFRPEDENSNSHSGLGLSISKQIIEGHGGVIACSNVQESNGESVVGSCFSITLPLLNDEYH